MAKTEEKPAKSDLFATYRTQAAERKAAESAILDLRTQESETIAQIVKHYGPGPWKLDGQLVKARKAKPDLGGLYAFHGVSLDAEEV